MLRCDRDICDLSMMCERQRQCILILLMQADDDALSALSVHIALWVHSNCCCCCCRSRSANHFILSLTVSVLKGAYVCLRECVFTWNAPSTGRQMNAAGTFSWKGAHFTVSLHHWQHTQTQTVFRRSTDVQECSKGVSIETSIASRQCCCTALDTSHHSVEDSGNSSSSHFTIPSLCPLHLLIKGSTRQWTVCTHTHSQHRQHDSVGYRRCLLN